MKLSVVASFLLFSLASPLLAEPYRLTAGDRITISHNLLAAPKTTMVDLDGNIRLADLGSITARDRSLDQLEGDVAQALVASGFSGTPLVFVELLEYAPVTVSGFVDEGGVFPYVPGMTVGVALARASNAGASSRSAVNMDVVALNAQRRATEAATSITSTVAEIARLEAALAGPDVPVTVSDALKSVVPASELPRLDGLIAAEAAVLDNDRKAAASLMASYAKEIADNDTQIRLLDERLALKAEVIAQLTQDLEASRDLRAQGLATTAQTTGVIQRLADEREDLLALETTKLTIQRSQALAERNRQQFQSDTANRWLTALNAARDRLNSLQAAYGFSQNELGLIHGNMNAMSLIDTGISLELSLRGPRADRIKPGEVTEETPLLPGDILVVRAVVAN